eukprot:GHRQ01022312.1.p2 GENE.GHRQ01022312.1~~GHRQ01022312.1.p2  ORF type:complete len:126 (-),score=9.17 GHRQ01022312.1:729-1106(-)
MQTKQFMVAGWYNHCRCSTEGSQGLARQDQKGTTAAASTSGRFRSQTCLLTWLLPNGRAELAPLTGSHMTHLPCSCCHTSVSMPYPGDDALHCINTVADRVEATYQLCSCIHCLNVLLQCLEAGQ